MPPPNEYSVEMKDGQIIVAYAYTEIGAINEAISKSKYETTDVVHVEEI